MIRYTCKHNFQNVWMTYVAKKVKLHLTILMKFNLKYEVYDNVFKKYKCF